MKLFDVYPLYDIEPVKAKGSYLWDKNGKKYLDFYGGHAVISVGHSHPYYIDKIVSQLNNMGFYSNSVKISLQEELAEKMGELSGYHNYNLFLCNSGAEANENALKLASFQNGRKKIIAFEKSFHGRTSLAVSATDDKKINAPINQNPNISFLPLNDEDKLEEGMSNDICAVIVEGIQGVGGIRMPSNSFLKKIKLLCQKFGALMIVDEVQSGYGRSGKFFAHQYADVKPDIISIAKGMGNGFPIGGILISPDIKPNHGMLGTTFGGNPLACAAAIAVLDIIKNENLISNALEIGNYIKEKITDNTLIKEVRGMGLMLGIELNHESKTAREDLLYYHQIFTGSSSNKNVIRLLPALTITKTEADAFVNSFKKITQKQTIQ